MSQGWSETRIAAAERTIEWLIRQIQDLIPQIHSAQESARTANQQYPTTSPGGSGGAFFCQPSGAVGGATGTWPSISPASFTADVYQASLGSITLVTAGATVSNYCASPLVASKTCPVIADGAGGYGVYTQSCT